MNIEYLYAVSLAVDIDISVVGVQDVLTVCPGDMVSLTCSHNNTGGELTRWQVSNESVMLCEELVRHSSGLSENFCDQFRISMISDVSGSTLNSTIVIPVIEALDGIVIECFAGGLSSSPLFGDVKLNVISKLLTSSYS